MQRLFRRVALVEPGGEGESEDMRDDGDGAENAGAFDHILVQLFSLVRGERISHFYTSFDAPLLFLNLRAGSAPQ
jgi:hypothetical protein